MSDLPPPPPPPPPPGRGSSRGPAGQGPGKEPGQDGQKRGMFGKGPGLPRWTIWVLLGVLVLLIFGSKLIPTESADKVAFGDFYAKLQAGQVESFKLNNETLKITGELKDGTKFTTTAPAGFPNEQDRQLIADKGVKFEPTSPQTNWI